MFPIPKFNSLIWILRQRGLSFLVFGMISPANAIVLVLQYFFQFWSQPNFNFQFSISNFVIFFFFYYTHPILLRFSISLSSFVCTHIYRPLFSRPLSFFISFLTVYASYWLSIQESRIELPSLRISKLGSSLSSICFLFFNSRSISSLFLSYLCTIVFHFSLKWVTAANMFNFLFDLMTFLFFLFSSG